MALDDFFDELLEKALAASDSTERQRLRPAPRRTFRVLVPVEVNQERPSSMPKPMRPRRRNESNSFIADSRVQINSSNSLQEMLLQKPFLHPEERSVIVVHGDHHGRLTDQPFPQSLRDRAQIHAQTADDHEQQSAGGELVVAAQYIFQNFTHSYSVVEISSSSSLSSWLAKPVLGHRR